MPRETLSIQPAALVAIRGATVKLIQAARLPAGHIKIVRADSEGLGVRDGNSLFELALETLHANGLSMADAVVEGKDGGGMNLIISNRGREPVLLEEGEVLGELHTAN